MGGSETERCPTCGSDDPGRCHAEGHNHPCATLSGRAARKCCPDPFHSPEADEQVGGEERVYTIWVCDGCGAYGTVSDLDRWGQCLVRHDESGDATGCIRPARQVEVVPASSSIPTEQLQEVVEWAMADYTAANSFCEGKASVARRLSALLEGTEDA